MTPATTEEAVADLPPSAKLVLKVLENAEDGPLSASAISERAHGLPAATTSRALGKLQSAGVVEAVATIDGDARTTARYRLSDAGEEAIR